MNSTFQGEGGILSLKAQLKPLKLLKTSIVISSIKLAIYFIVAITLISLAINHNLFALLIFGGFFVGIFALSLINDEITLLKSLTKEYKTYGL
jgi:protein-S-isoprenylcysteine O-methyltransferase Ste14